MKGEIKANVQICKFPKLLSSLSLTLWHSFDECRLICASFFPLVLESLSVGAMTSGSPAKDWDLLCLFLPSFSFRNTADHIWFWTTSHSSIQIIAVGGVINTPIVFLFLPFSILFSPIYSEISLLWDPVPFFFLSYFFIPNTSPFTLCPTWYLLFSFSSSASPLLSFFFLFILMPLSCPQLFPPPLALCLISLWFYLSLYSVKSLDLSLGWTQPSSIVRGPPVPRRPEPVSCNASALLSVWSEVLPSAAHVPVLRVQPFQILESSKVTFQHPE